MASKYGLRAYGRGVYSRDFSDFRIVIKSASAVAVTPRVRISARFAIHSQSAVMVEGRLLWDRILVPSCEGAWTPIGRNPCAVVTP